MARMFCAPRLESTTRASLDSTSRARAAPTAGAPFRPDIFVFDKDFKNPRTISGSIGYDMEVLNQLAASIAYTYAATDNLTRFVNRNDGVFGSPWTSGLNGTANGVGVLTTVE